MLPCFVTSCEDSVALVEIDESRFRMLGRGALARFAPGYRYLLVDRRLARALKSLKVPRITFCPAVVHDPVSGAEHRSHVRVFVASRLQADEIGTLALDGHQLLSLNGEHYFVSPTLMQALVDHGFDDLQFAEGLSGFAKAA